MPRNGSVSKIKTISNLKKTRNDHLHCFPKAPQFNYARSIPKNGSVPMFNQMQRKHSFKAVPLGSVNPANRNSKPNLQERRRSSIKNSVLSFVASKSKINGEEISNNLVF